MRAIGVINEYRKRFALAIAGSVFSVGLVLAPAAGAITIGGPSDCDSNAVIRCGAHSTSALKQAYNSSAYVQKVYAYFGISNADMANLSSTDVAGTVTKDGKVFIGSQSRAVATNAVTGGRQSMAGSVRVNFAGITFFKRPPSVSFQQNSLPAFVSMKNGVFQFAVIASCGNAVRATPTTAPQHAAVAPARAVSRPAPPKPQPKPVPSAPTQTQSQSQEVNVNNSNTNTQNTTVATPASTSTTATTPETVAAAQPAATAPASSSLPNTGPTGTIGIFLASTFLGVLGYRKFLLHRLTG